jgi:hypothetical protein
MVVSSNMPEQIGELLVRWIKTAENGEHVAIAGGIADSVHEIDTRNE